MLAMSPGMFLGRTKSDEVLSCALLGLNWNVPILQISRIQDGVLVRTRQYRRQLSSKLVNVTAVFTIVTNNLVFVFLIQCNMV